MLIGIDEAGRGPVIGPLVVAGIAVAEDTPLRAIGVRDSKRLRAKKREGIYRELKGLAIAHCVRVVSAKTIDEERKHRSLNDIEAEYFAQIIDELLKAFLSRHDVNGGKSVMIRLDAADASAHNFKLTVLKYLRRFAPTLFSNNTHFVVEARHKADDTYPEVSAASIIAKVTRDRQVRSIEETIGCPIGSGYPGDRVTRAFLEDYVKTNGALPLHTRHSWVTAKKLLERWASVHNRTLDDFP